MRLKDRVSLITGASSVIGKAIATRFAVEGAHVVANYRPDPTAMKNAVSEIPWGRFGNPAEVASIAVFLASDEAEYVTGSTYLIDGGLSQQVTIY